MEAVFVDDNVAYAEELTDREWSTDHVQFIPAGSREIGDLSSREIAKRVAEEVGDDDAVVFINVNLKSEGKSRQDQAGVEVLKFLRLTERFDERENEAQDTHCVMYSFQSIGQLLRKKPSSLIVCSDGVTFKRLPSEVSELDLGELAKEKASVDNLDKFLRGEFRLPDERHSWANWWGLKQLYDVHRLVAGQPNLDYPEPVTNKMNELDAMVGRSIFGHDSEEIREEFRELEERINDVRSRVLDKSVVAIQIDDMWEEGWREVFEKMIHSHEKENNIYPVDGDYSAVEQNLLVDDVYKKVRGLIKSKEVNVDVILLDLRLLDKDAGQFSVKKLSGAKILNKLREEFKGIPVIVTTASNKAWSHETLMEIGADGYWIKEGIDQKKNATRTINNYYEIIKLIDTVTEEKYQLLRWLDEKINNLKGSELWWENKEWHNGDTTKADTGEVRQILKESLLMLRSYLGEVELRTNVSADEKHSVNSSLLASKDESFWISAIIQQMSNIIEVVHNLGEKGSRLLKRYERNDQIATYLHFIRNYVSHNGWYGELTFNDLRFFVELTMVWLLNEKYTEGLRGRWDSHENRWYDYDEFTDEWGNDFEHRDKYTGHRNTRIYAQIFWWLTHENKNAQQKLEEKHKKHFIKLVCNILRNHHKKYESDWANIRSRIVNSNENTIALERVIERECT